MQYERSAGTGLRQRHTAYAFVGENEGLAPNMEDLNGDTLAEVSDLAIQRVGSLPTNRSIDRVTA